MNLNELKSMIAEEYRNYMAEQPVPQVAVSDADVDATGGEDPEATLRDIYDMLKDYFEGDAGANAADTADAADDMDDDMTDVDDDEGGEEALQERFKKLANIIKG